jgi:hypothetical protein
MASLRKLVTAIVLLGIATPIAAYGQTLTAAWDANPAADQVTDYQVCIGTTSLSCNFQLTTVPATENSYTFTPTAGVLYFIAVRAISTAGPGQYSSEIRVSIPSLAQPANQTSTANVPITPLTLSGSDPDGGTLQYSHTGLPFGLSLNTSTGAITGTPTTTGTFTVNVFVTDGLASASRTFGWTVQPPSAPDTSAPTLTITSHSTGQTVTTSSITLSGSATDSGTGGSGISSVTVSGAAATGGTATGNNTANWSRSVSLVIGTNNIAVEARDGANNLSASQITINRIVAPVTGVTLNSTPASPQQTGTPITFTASGSGGVAPREYKFLVQQGSGAQQVAQTWSTTATYTWTPSAAGNYTVTVWARSAGVTTDAAQASAQRSYVITAPLVASLTSSVASPQLVGTGINFTAAATGGTSPYQFKFWVQSAGGAWTMARDWNTSTSFTWQPATAGSYVVAVWARNAGVTADASQALAQVNYTITAPAPLSVTSLTGSVASPQTVGTAVTFTAAATGGTAPYQFKFLVQSGSVWTTVQNWSTSTSFTWQPTTAGSYVVAVWARNAGVTADASQALAQVNYTINAPPPPSITALTSSVASPQVTGTAVTFNATATGGTAPYQFKWWVQTVGGSWTMMQNWSTSASFTWQPATAGNYVVAVWARNAGVTADASQALSQVNYTIAAPAAPLSVTNLTSSVASPQTAGTAVTFTAAATGGTAPYQFKFLVQSGGVWTTARDWNTSASFTWQPAAAGSYVVAVWARNAGVTTDASQALAQVNYTINALTTPLSVTSLTSSVASPQVAGTPITFTAAATGGTAPYQFKFWVQSAGGTWTLARDWNTSASFTWTPATAASYVVAVWARNAGVTADASQALTQVNYTINAPATPLAVTGLTSSVASPQVAGTPIAFTATASGGTAPYQFKFWVQSVGGAWTMARDWNTSASFTWTPATAGSYMVAVWARNAGVTADASQALSQIAYTINSSTAPLSVTGLTSSVASPQVAGTPITFTAAATGGTAPYQFKFWVQGPGGGWTMARDWNTSASFTWQPSTAGSFVVAVWARNAGVTADASQALTQMAYTIDPPTALLSVTGLTSNVASPQVTGTAITFTAAATGGTAPYQFKWWVQIGGVWTMVQNWSTSASFTWQPTTPGNYSVAVWARNAGVITDASQALSQVAYSITAPSMPSVTGLTSSVASPQRAGTAITFSATASGGTAPYQFKWWVQRNGGSWTMAQDWSTSASFPWQPSNPGTYSVAVWVRNAGVTADASQALAQVPFVLTGNTTPLSITSLTSSATSPQPADTTITFTAVAAGGTAPYQFKWWIKNAAGAWTVAQNWGTSATFAWHPLVAGNYEVAVWARNAGVTDDASQALAQLPYTLTPAAPTNPLVMSMTSNVASPQVLGNSVTFTAAATGGTAPYQFKWWIHDGTQWSVAREWGGATFNWQPVRTGNYIVAAWVRNAGVTGDASQALAQMPYVISTLLEIPPAITSFTSSVASPSPANATVTFNATATGGIGDYQFKWWVYANGQWSVGQEWRDSSSFAWKPKSPGTYIVAVWVRNDGVTADASQALAYGNFTITP